MVSEGKHVTNEHIENYETCSILFKTTFKHTIYRVVCVCLECMFGIRHAYAHIHVHYHLDRSGGQGYDQRTGHPPPARPPPSSAMLGVGFSRSWRCIEIR